MVRKDKHSLNKDISALSWVVVESRNKQTISRNKIAVQRIFKCHYLHTNGTIGLLKLGIWLWSSALSTTQL